jgi:hypothetical protein
MGFFNKMLFWKRRDEMDFDDLADKETRMARPKDDMDFSGNLGMDEKSPFPEDNSSNFKLDLPKMAAPLHDKDLELISSKLDTIKAMLASVEQRLANVEQSLGSEKKQRLW